MKLPKAPTRAEAEAEMKILREQVREDFKAWHSISEKQTMKDRLLIFVLMWFFPWGFASLALWMLGYAGLGALLGSTSAIGIAFVLAMAKAAKDN